jgi:hypothetical protein
VRRELLAWLFLTEEEGYMVCWHGIMLTEALLHTLGL